MASFTFGIGKGLREPCSPNREANVFGAALNTPNATGWNCLAVLVNPTTSFDLSLISSGCEVVVALLGVNNTVEGEVSVRFRWHRDRDNALLFSGTYSLPTFAGGWFFAYSHIGYLPWELSENGAYSVDISASGAVTFSRSISFTISGITPAEPALPPPTGFAVAVVEALNTVSSRFYEIYRTVYEWPPPIYYLGTSFYSLSSLFNSLAWGASTFFTTFNELWAWVHNTLSWDTIWSFIIDRLPRLADLNTWFYNWWYNVNSVVSSWWTSTMGTVQGWIQVAKQYAADLFSSVNAGLLTLQGAWDNFKGRIPTIEQVIYWWGNWAGNVNTVLTTWWAGQLLEIQGLINSAFTARQSLWAGWQEMRDNVAGFFDDPVEYIWDRFIDWFLGPEV